MVMVVVGVQLAGLFAHSGPGLGVCVHACVCVCVSGSWCVLAGCVLAAPASDTTTVGPLWISFAPPALPHNLPPSSSSLPGKRPGRLIPTFHLLLLIFLLLPLLLHCLSISNFSIISEPQSACIKKKARCFEKQRCHRPICCAVMAGI